MKKLIPILIVLFSLLGKEANAGPGSGGYFEMTLSDSVLNIWRIRYTMYNDCNDPKGDLDFCIQQYGNYDPTNIGNGVGWQDVPGFSGDFGVSPDAIDQICYDLPSCSGPCKYQILTKSIYNFT